MNKTAPLAVALLTIASASFAEETNSVAQAEFADPNAWAFNAGADFRIRQEIVDNLPGLPGDPYSMTTTLRAKYRNQIRMRPRVWFEVEKGPFRLYTRVADEFREYPALKTPRQDRMYNFPDEVFLDNLYLEGKGLEADWLASVGIESLDFRLGRQDMLEGGHSIYGLDRLVAEGTPLDGSRSFFSDMVRATLHFDETRQLDAFALYDSGLNEIRWGTPNSYGRTLTAANMSDTNDYDEWGGGLIYSQRAFDGQLPFKLYAMFKRNEGHRTMKPTPVWRPAKEITLLGLWMEPRLSDLWSVEIETGKQVGRIVEGNREAGGQMAHVELKYHSQFLKEYKPVLSAAFTYYSGDKHRTGADDSDTSWDPMWARYTQDSEMLVYGTLYENCWWSNMIYAKAKLSMTFGPHHGLYLYTGPMFAAVQDDLGHADGGGSAFKGLLSAGRYDFPVRLAPKNASGWDRIEVFAHLLAEFFNPGDYYESSKPSFFFRWQVDFRF